MRRRVEQRECVGGSGVCVFCCFRRKHNTSVYCYKWAMLISYIVLVGNHVSAGVGLSGVRNDWCLRYVRDVNILGRNTRPLHTHTRTHTYTSAQIYLNYFHVCARARARMRILSSLNDVIRKLPSLSRFGSIHLSPRTVGTGIKKKYARTSILNRRPMFVWTW